MEQWYGFFLKGGGMDWCLCLVDIQNCSNLLEHNFLGKFCSVFPCVHKIIEISEMWHCFYGLTSWYQTEILTYVIVVK